MKHSAKTILTGLALMSSSGGEKTGRIFFFSSVMIIPCAPSGPTPVRSANPKPRPDRKRHPLHSFLQCPIPSAAPVGPPFSPASTTRGQWCHRKLVQLERQPVRVCPRELGKAGYQTGLIGKWHLKGNPRTNSNPGKFFSGKGGRGSYYNPTFLPLKEKRK